MEKSILPEAELGWSFEEYLLMDAAREAGIEVEQLEVREVDGVDEVGLRRMLSRLVSMRDLGGLGAVMAEDPGGAVALLSVAVWLGSDGDLRWRAFVSANEVLRRDGELRVPWDGAVGVDGVTREAHTVWLAFVIWFGFVGRRGGGR